MKILVQTVSKENTEIEVSGNTVGDLRAEIIKVKNISADKDVKIIFNGKILEKDGDTFEQVGIKETLNKVVIFIKNKASAPVAPAVAATPVKAVAPAPSANAAVPAPSAKAPTSVPSSSAPAPLVNLFDLAAQAQAGQQHADMDGMDLPGIPEMGDEAAMFQQLLMSNPQMITQMLMNSPQFQQNPQAIEQMLSNPEFIQQIVASLMQSMGSGGPGGPMGIQITLSPEEMEQVQQLEALGIAHQEALYYYESCGRNVELAAEMIFQDLNNPDNNNQDDQDAYYEEGGGDQSQ